MAEGIKEHGPVIMTSAAVVAVLVVGIMAKIYGPDRSRRVDDPPPPEEISHKGDKLPLAFTGSFELAEQKPLPDVVTMPPIDVPVIIREAKPEQNICSRDGGRKVFFYRHHHESWRCVYPRRR